MHWRFKSLNFKILSMLPGGQAFHGFTQEKITGSTTATHDRIKQKVEVGLRYWDWLRAQERTNQVINGNLLDFGAGWHPTIPLLLHSFGNRSQLLVDIQPNLDAQKLTDTARLLNQIITAPDFPHRNSCRTVPEIIPPPQPLLAAALQPLGIRYEAPFGDFTTRPAGEFDVVFCTQVLQHISLRDQQAIFRQLCRALKPGGLIMGVVHLVGHFRNPNLRSGQYDHLTLSPWLWEHVINSSLMSYNRLKAPDYRSLLGESGFKILNFEVEQPTPADLAELGGVKIHPAFRRYAPEELAARHIFFVAEKP